MKSVGTVIQRKKQGNQQGKMPYGSGDIAPCLAKHFPYRWDLGCYFLWLSYWNVCLYNSWLYCCHLVELLCCWMSFLLTYSVWVTVYDLSLSDRCHPSDCILQHWGSLSPAVGVPMAGVAGNFPFLWVFQSQRADVWLDLLWCTDSFSSRASLEEESKVWLN